MSVKAVGLKAKLPQGVPERVIIGIVRETAENAKRLYDSTTSTWSKRPKFTVKAVKRTGAIAWETATDSAIYGFVDYGTRPHKIRAKGKLNGGADRLRFQTGFAAKTKPSTFGSFNGASFGDVVRPVEVDHPGSEPRNFSKDIADLSQKEFAITAQRSINAWISKKHRPSKK